MADDKPIAPRNTRELFRWLLFEWPTLEAYSDSLSRKERLVVLWRPLLYIATGATVWWLGVAVAVTALDLPGHFPSIFQENITEKWGASFRQNLCVCLEATYSYFLVFGLAFSLAFGLAFSLAAGLLVGLAFSSAIGLAYGLAVGLVYGSARGLAYGLAFGLTFGLTFNLVFLLFVGLVFGLAIGLAIGLTEDMAVGLAEGVGIVIGWLIAYFRLPLYSWYALGNIIRPYTLANNPHRRDWAIGFPIPRLQAALAREAVRDPEQGEELAEFLLEKRRYQNLLAYCLLHAAFAGKLRQRRLDYQVLSFFNLPKRANIYRPSAEWYRLLGALRQARLDAGRENNIHARLAFWDLFIDQLQKFREQTRLEPRAWSQYYQDPLEQWTKSAREERDRLELVAKNTEPICRNIYRGGEKLDPRVDRPVFFGRQDLRDAFMSRALTATGMPLFFIQGQRRVGKSSLISFLPTFLDSGFVVVSYDMQEQPGGVVAWLLALRERLFQVAFPGETPPDWAPPADDWLESWRQFRQELEALVAADGRRFVLAVDEYETLHGYLSERPDEGGRLLGALRSYSQSQNRVVWLFAGADFFSELRAPNWNEFFPQAVTLYVDYLSREDSLRLIRAVDLRYPPELLDELYELTQGHPTLLQKICHELVAIANTQGRRDMTRDDLRRVLADTIIKPVNGVTDVFWGQFCALRGLQPVVHQLAEGRVPDDRRALLLLEEHRFITQRDGQWRLRVPLFEQWVRRYHNF